MFSEYTVDGRYQNLSVQTATDDRNACRHWQQHDARIHAVAGFGFAPPQRRQPVSVSCGVGRKRYTRLRSDCHLEARFSGCHALPMASRALPVFTSLCSVRSDLSGSKFWGSENREKITSESRCFRRLHGSVRPAQRGAPQFWRTHDAGRSEVTAMVAAGQPEWWRMARAPVH